MLPLLVLGASSQSGPLNVRSPSGRCLHFQKINSGDHKQQQLRKYPCERLLPCLKDFGVCLLKVLEKFLFQVENTVDKIMEEKHWGSGIYLLEILVINR